MKRYMLAMLLALALGCNGGSPAGFGIPVDTDGDGLSDDQETNDFKTSPNLPDTDSDGLNDYEEIMSHGTNPLSVDTDLDTLRDIDEIQQHGTDPTKADSDGDGLHDNGELSIQTNPLAADTDADGFSDGDEVVLGLQPRSYNHTGIVSQVLCDDNWVVTSAFAVGVYLDFMDVFQIPFVAGDIVVFSDQPILERDPTGAILANLRTLESGFGTWEGAHEFGGGFITDAYPTTFSVGVDVSSGFSFEINFLDVDALDNWYVGDHVEIIGPRDPVDPYSAYKMLNTDVCETVLISD